MYSCAMVRNMQRHTDRSDMQYLVRVGHRAQRTQQDLRQTQVVVTSSHVQTCVTHLKPGHTWSNVYQPWC